jgi:putative flippase GtrA
MKLPAMPAARRDAAMANLPSRETRIRAARFIVVGGTAYVVQYLTTALFYRLGFSTDVGFTLGFVCSTSTHYTLNRFWALPSLRTDTWRQLREYLGTAALSWVINYGLFHLCLDVFGFSKLTSTAIAVPPSTLVVFLLLNYRVFRTKPRVE